MYQMTMKT